MYFIVDPLPIIVLLSVHWTNFKLRAPRAVQAYKKENLNDESMDFTKFETNDGHHDTASVANSAAHSALIFDSYHMQSQESFIAKDLFVKFQLNRNSGSVIVDLP